MKRTVRIKDNNCDSIYFTDKITRVVASKAGDLWDVEIHCENDGGYNKITGVPEEDKNRLLAMFEEAGEK